MKRGSRQSGNLTLAFLLAVLIMFALALVGQLLGSILLREPEPKPEPPVLEAPEPEYGRWGPMIAGIDPSPYDSADFSRTDTRINHPSALQGIDLSSHNGEIDWAAVAADGIDFAILQVGYRGYSLGGLSADETFLRNAQAAAEHGVSIGAYFFSQCLSVAEAEEEAHFLLEVLDGQALDWPIYFDWEPVAGESRTNGVDTDFLTDSALAFCKILTDAGYRAGVYFNQEYAYLHYDLRRLQDLDWWLAEYTAYPSFYYDFDLWQYSCTGYVSGIDVETDLNLSFRDYR